MERRKEKPPMGNLAWKVRRPIAYMLRLRKTEQKEEQMLEPRSDAKVEVIEQCHKGVRMFLEHLPPPTLTHPQPEPWEANIHSSRHWAIHLSQ